MSKSTLQHPDYTIVRELGRGGSATVYLAVQKSLNRQVAFKVLHGYAADQGERFLREGRIVAKLNHPTIVPVYDVGTLPDNGGYFMTMEYLKGGSLRERLPEFMLRDLFRTLDQICDALSLAHDQGFVHRDVKPDNILFRSKEEALLADFGIARPTDSLTQMTVTGTMLGTPDYMSPEQVSGDEVDARSDLYSLGIVFYEALTGYRPLQGDNVMSTGLQQIAGTPSPLPKNVQHWQGLMNRLLAKQPSKRPGSAAELREEIAALRDKWSVDMDAPLAGLHTGAAPKQNSIAVTIARQRRRMPFALAVSLIVLAAGFGTYTYIETQRALPTTEIVQPVQRTPTPLEVAVQRANESFALERWFGEQTDAALTLYRKVLEHDPSNELATARIEAMLDTSLTRVQRQIANEDFTAADSLIAELEMVFDDKRVVAMRNKLSDAASDSRSRERLRNQNARIAQLIEQASTAAAAGRFTGEASAASLYAAVLEINPNHVLARNGFNNIVETLFARANRAIADNAFDAAHKYLADAAVLVPNDPRLAQMNEKHAAARESFDKEQQLALEKARLDGEINVLAQRVDNWLSTPDAVLDDTYETLVEDLERLLAEAPEARELQRLVAATERQAEQLRTRQQENSQNAKGGDDLDQGRFARPVF